MAHGCIAGSMSQTLRFLQHPSLRSSRVASVRPLAPRHGRLGFVMVPAWLFSPLIACWFVGLHAAARARRVPARVQIEHRRVQAAGRVTATHRSRTLPPAPQPKQCHMPLPRWAANDRLRGDREPCTGQGPRSRWP